MVISEVEGQKKPGGNDDAAPIEFGDSGVWMWWRPTGTSVKYILLKGIWGKGQW